MKILICGDQHFRGELPYASLFEDGRKGEWEAVKQAILDQSRMCDAVVLMGDNLNARNNTSIVLKEFVEFLKAFGEKEVYILAGNHERSGHSTALDFLQKLDHPNWHVYTEVTQGVKIGDTTATFIPFVTPALLNVPTKQEADALILSGLVPNRVAFCHHAVMGAKSTEFFEGEIVLDRNRMETLFSQVFYGHIHKAEKLSYKIQGTGSIFTHEVGEAGKSVWVYDTESQATEEVKLPVRGIYKHIWEDEFELLAPKDSIIKCYVTSRGTNIDVVKKFLEHFDASVVIEQYPSERVKAHIEDGGLDLGVENLLKMYGEAKGLDYADLQEGYELIK